MSDAKGSYRAVRHQSGRSGHVDTADIVQEAFFGHSCSMTSDVDDRENRLYLKALGVRHEHKPGLWEPIIWHLALRHDSEAMIDLASSFCDTGKWPGKLGSQIDRFSAAGLYYRAFRLGNARAAQHLAIHYFNSRNMRGYRHWLRRGANLGDGYAANQAKHFETRMPHSTARRIRRLRPYHKRDETY